MREPNKSLPIKKDYLYSISRQSYLISFAIIVNYIIIVVIIIGHRPYIYLITTKGKPPYGRNEISPRWSR